MQTSVKITLSILVLYLLSACVGTKKIDFESAYKFSRYKYQESGDKELHHTVENESSQPLLTSTAQVEIESVHEKIAVIEDKIYSKLDIDRNEVNRLDANEVALKYKKLTNSEKKKLRKEIKEELKDIKYLMAKNTFDKNDIQQINTSTDHTRLVILLGGVGLILLILGAIFSGFILFVGAIAVVAAAVLFIIDQA